MLSNIARELENEANNRNRHALARKMFSTRQEAFLLEYLRFNRPATYNKLISKSAALGVPA